MRSLEHFLTFPLFKSETSYQTQIQFTIVPFVGLPFVTDCPHFVTEITRPTAAVVVLDIEGKKIMGEMAEKACKNSW